ncbi:MAG TPA: DNA translocase FtsK 4TM domain-containing protein, partial [Gemmatimonadales bacterium]|nr:DNA translocase FtsK 4TM domain-containing protein [Gemmatimonadales bacterium]
MYNQRVKNMPASEKTSARTAANPLPPRLAALVREFRWFALLGLALYLVLVLCTFHRADPGWSHSAGAVSAIQNAGGRVGAWVADVMLHIFGLSAYWWVVLCGVLVWWGFHRIEDKDEDGDEETDRRSYAVAGIGFVIVLMASTGIEATRLYTLKAELPQAPGGILGSVVGGGLSQALGFTGATLILLMLLAAGLSLFTGVSWLTVIERVGGWSEWLYAFVLKKWQEREDRKAGAEAVVQREVVVEESKKKLEVHVPVRIEPAAVSIPKSTRVEKEKQVPPFDNLPDSMLPPLGLLDEPEKATEVISTETLEFTSRLIEKKLLDFGVEVKVVAAYPGPVITRYEIEPAVGVKGSQIINLIKDLARALSVISIRVIETIPGKSLMGLE